MENYKDMIRIALESLGVFLKKSGFEVVDPTISNYTASFEDKGFLIATQTKRYFEYSKKYILVTPEEVVLIGKKTPYNFTEWVRLQSKEYTSKEELMCTIKSYIISPYVEKLWV